MNKLKKFMEEKFIPTSTKIGNNKYLKSIAGGSMGLMAVIMVGAIFSLLSSIPFAPYTNFIESIGIKTVLDFVPKVTTDLLAVYMAFSVAYNAAKEFGHKEIAFNNGIFSLVSFMLLVPLQQVMQEGAFQPDTLINLNYLGSRGAFVALITGVIVTMIHCFIVNKNWTIKMPEGVPEQVSKAFVSLIPAFVILIVFSLIKAGFAATSYKSANNFIYSMIQTPVQNLTGSLPAFIIIVLLAQILWFFGVHGSYTVLPIFMPIWMGYIQENTAAVAAGQAIPHIYNVGLNNLTTIGGCGGTLGLVIVMFFFAKSERYKTFSKMVLPCGIFNVNEPLVFGMPIMLNVVLLIPFILTPLIILLLAVLFINIGLMPAPVGLMIPSSTPPILSGLMQGSWRLSVFEVFAIALSAVIYLPFFKVLDNQALKEEQAAKNNLGGSKDEYKKIEQV